MYHGAVVGDRRLVRGFPIVVACRLCEGGCAQLLARHERDAVRAVLREDQLDQYYQYHRGNGAIYVCAGWRTFWCAGRRRLFRVVARRAYRDRPGCGGGGTKLRLYLSERLRPYHHANAL